WLLSSEARAFASQNFQDYQSHIDEFEVLYSGVGDGTTIVAEKYERTSFRLNDAEFVFGFDVRAEAAFELTRDISLSMGVQVMHFAQGIARGNSPDFDIDNYNNDEDLTMVGGTLGLTINR